MTTLTTNATYSIPASGWYQFHVVGRGGTGGEGGQARQTGQPSSSSPYNPNAVSSGGSSGSTGAYAIHQVYLTRGATINITVDSAKTTATIDGKLVSAIAGVNGTNGNNCSNGSKTYDSYASPVSAASAASVIASGGNVVNIGGVQGNGSQSRWGGYAAGGPSNFITNGLAIYTPKSQTLANQSAESHTKCLGGGGGGGNGLATYYKDWVMGDPGGSGGMGGVVVEKTVNNPPTDPGHITYGTPIANRTLHVSWGESTDDDGHSIYYVLEHRTDNNAYTSVLETADTQATVTVPSTGVNYQLRVKAVDGEGADSDYCVGPAKAILYNAVPEISGVDIDYGALELPLVYSYSIADDPPDDVLHVTERLVCDYGEYILRSHTAEINQTYTIDLTNWWLFVPNTDAQLIIHVVDSYGEQATRTITFHRNATRMAAFKSFQTELPVVSCRVLLDGDVPDTFEICNNPNDLVPRWEDITSKINATTHVFGSAQPQRAPGLAFRFYSNSPVPGQVVRVKSITTEIEF